MSDEPDQPRLTRFVVALERPPDGWGGPHAVTGRARAAADELTAERVKARFDRATFVLDDSSSFLLDGAGSSETVGEAGRRGQPAIGRVDESMRIANDQEVTP
jgi:hypothetical protein